MFTYIELFHRGMTTFKCFLKRIWR